MRTALSIAGSDTSGGAGIQADLKTMTANGVFAMSAITALTAQNTTGVTGIMDVTPDFLKKEIEAVFDDIRPDAVKIGMVSSSALIEAIAEELKNYKAENIVVDPVMVATSGARLIAEEAIGTLKQVLLPISTVITPNIPEAEILADMVIGNEADMEVAAAKICHSYGCAVLLKGGHSISDANDLLYEKNGDISWFRGRRIHNSNTHGTGCTLSSAIAANLAKGYSLKESIRRAKEYISMALAAMLDLGAGSGPMNHAFDLVGEFAEYPAVNIAKNTLPRSWDSCPEGGVIRRLLKAAEEIWQRYDTHPFVQGLAGGTLDKEKFKYYMLQDYVYLIDYAKVFAVGVAKSRDFAMMQKLANSVQLILNGEMNIHKGYMARLGITPEEAAATRQSLDNNSYTSYMMRIAYEYGPAEVAVAILSCALSYEGIGRTIIENHPDANRHEFYGDWVSGYMSDEYQADNFNFITLIEQATADYTEEQLQTLETIFLNCSRYEYEFWNMAWSMRE